MERRSIMRNSPLKVYGEYLIPVGPAAATMTGTNVLRAGKSMSGLEVVVCAEDDFSLDAGESATISILHSQDGETFIALPPWEKTIAAPGDDPSASSADFKPGDILARMTLPVDCLPYIKGNLAFSAVPGGKVSMFPAYLPR
jgi:hypothetical protein